MNQDQNYGADYLNQISASGQPNAPSPLVMIAAIGGGIVALIIFGFMIFGGGPSTVDKWTALYQRVASLESVAKKQSSHLKDSEIRDINSRLAIFLPSAQNEIQQIAEKIGVVTSKIPEKYKSEEASYLSKLEAKLEDARITVVLDRTYAREMAYEIGVLISLMRQAYSVSGSSTKEVLESINLNLADYAKEFNEFEDTK